MIRSCNTPTLSHTLPLSAFTPTVTRLAEWLFSALAQPALCSLPHAAQVTLFWCLLLASTFLVSTLSPHCPKTKYNVCYSHVPKLIWSRKMSTFSMMLIGVKF
ncbi:hypothetical protein DSO57_1020188 [Entomophthora muscae]|uniref:Uncharacterized protein n=1 Tax=Entomophthora muscae TaxID=34485 RepID=A0ACC2TR64_9FUNG|nr:hypothetical protein DSO57_1020188 [Entomophthora muscae]